MVYHTAHNSNLLILTKKKTTMQKMIIRRIYTPTMVQGFGVLIGADNSFKYTFQTLELPDLNNKHDVSCIPSGTYQCWKKEGAFHAPSTKGYFTVANVPDRMGILIHAGNFIGDTKGCILVGSGWYHNEALNELALTQTCITLNALFDKCETNFELTII